MLTLLKKADHILEMPGLEDFLVIVSRILHVKVGCRLNLTNRILDQRRCFAIVLFPGTPCTYGGTPCTYSGTHNCTVSWDTLYLQWDT